jgi:hypothetical protein
LAICRRPWVVCILYGYVLFEPACAVAEQPDVAALRQQVIALEQQLHDVQAQLRQLESAKAVTASIGTEAPASAAKSAGIEAAKPSSEPALRQNWSKVKPAMEYSKVAELLGEPSTRFKLDGRDVWYYDYPGTGRGSVFFSEKGRVTSSWSPFGW